MVDLNERRAVYDPLELSRIAERRTTKIVEGKVYRKYWRFRGGRWYGGIATGDVVGCNLRCGMCWSWRSSFSYETGSFYSPDEVSERLMSIAEKNNYESVRISGGEPTISKPHLLDVLKGIEERFNFILETNGILIDDQYARDLSSFQNLIVRVSIKGASPEECSSITLADGKYFFKQIQALESLVQAGFIPCREVYPAAMLGFTPEGGEKDLLERLSKIDERLPECLDVEYVILYPHVERLMRSRGLKPVRWVAPDGIPSSMV